MNKKILPKLINHEDEIISYQRAIHSLIRKLDQRIIPFMVLLQINRFSFQIAMSKCFISTFFYIDVQLDI
jgi:hypothetical protein